MPGVPPERKPPALRYRFDRLADKVILVAGASSGIGAAAARRFAEEGASVVLAARRMPLLSELVGQLRSKGLNASCVSCDVLDETSVMNAVRAAKEAYGHLDGALNTAGIQGQPVRLGQLAVEDYDAVQDVNARGTFLLMKHEINAMLDRGGAIVNTSSALGLLGYSKLAEYSASKAAIHAMTRSAALAYARDGIRVNAFAPGLTRSDEPGEPQADAEWIDAILAGTPLAQVASADDMARVALFLLSDESRFITGAVLPADGGISAGRQRWI